MAIAECGCGGALELGDDAMGQPLACPYCSGIVRAVAGGKGGADLFATRLTIAAGPDRVGEQILLGGDGAIGLGKLATNPIRFITPMISRNHCELARTPGGGWFISDRNSTNGLFVNRQRVKAHELKDGDIIRIGEYELTFGASPSTSQTAAAPLASSRNPAHDDTDDTDDTDD